MLDVTRLALLKGCIVRGITMGLKQLLDELVQFVVNKGLEPPIEKTFRFSPKDVYVVYEYMQGGSHVRKIYISIE